MNFLKLTLYSRNTELDYNMSDKVMVNMDNVCEIYRTKKGEDEIEVTKIIYNFEIRHSPAYVCVTETPEEIMGML